jgi:RHS repeat-associated protein
MKTCARIAIVLTVLGMGVAARAQTCTSPIAGWQGNYSYTMNGTVTDSTGVMWSVSHSAAADVDANNRAVLSCTAAEWFSLNDTNVTASSNATGVHPPCSPPSAVPNSTITFVGTGYQSTSILRIDTSSGTYSYSAFPGVSSGTVTYLGCDGTTMTVAGVWNMFPASWALTPSTAPTFPLPSSIQPLTVNAPVSGQGEWVANGTGIILPWTLSFTLNPIYSTDDPCQQAGNSSIGCQNQSLGEDVLIVGTGFNLHYESGRAPGAGANSVASADAAMMGGWTLSAHHAYDGNTLLLGNGRQRNAYQLGTPVVFNGNFLVTSEDGSEVYVFSGSTGQHLQTVRPLTGALEYQFGYDAAGMLVTVTDANGNVTTIQRDASEHPTAIVSPYGQTTSLSVNSNGFLSQVTDPLGKSATFTNSSTGLLVSRTDENGNIFNYTYDSQGRLTNDADSLGGFTALARTNAASGFGWTVGETTAMGRTSGYQTTLSAPWVQTATSTFSKQHTNIWPNGLQATGTKTQQGSQISESVALPDGTSYGHTLSPDPIWGIQLPIATSQTLTKGNLTMSIIGSSTASLGTAANPFSLISRTDQTTINFRTYTSTFTTSNLTFVNTTPVGRKLTTVLDNQERIASTQIGGLLASNFAYDSRGRLSSVTRGTRASTFTYDSGGRLATATDPVGLNTSFSYDPDGRVLSTTLPDGRVINYNYDANGNLTAVIPPGKSAHDFSYTAVNQMSQYLPPSVSGTGSTDYSYNTDRDITKITRPDGNAITFGYDSAGRLSSDITPSETIGYTYSSTTGNLTAAAITNGEALSYGYNGPLPTSTSWTGTVNGSVSLAYNHNFWVTSRSINGGNTIAFSYDNDGLVSTAGQLALYRSSQNGLISGTTLGLASDSRSYNSFGELTGYTASSQGGRLYGMFYTRDADGRISNKTEIRGFHITTYTYSYDPASRLVGVSQNGTAISSYSYDTNSNRLQATTPSGTVSATYDAQDRLLTYGTATYTYTANGELASQTVGALQTAFQYDVLGNLVSVALPSGKAISYVVDAENRRVGKMVNGTLVDGFLYDGARIVAQLNGTNNIVNQFIYASRATSPDFMERAGVTYRIFSDHLGSPLLVVNTSTGAIAEEITYDEFGNVLSDTNPGLQPFGFAGGLYDQDTKLVRFGARDYNPSSGRWTAKDSILFAGGDTNLFAYASSDPVNFRDPRGWEVQAADAGSESWISKAWDLAVETGERVTHAIGDRIIENDNLGEHGPPNLTPPTGRRLNEYVNANKPGTENAESTWSFSEWIKKTFNSCSCALKGGDSCQQPTKQPPMPPPKQRPGPLSQY